MGKQEYKYSNKVRFGELPKVERKVLTKMLDKSGSSGFEHTAICTEEIGSMLACFEAHAWGTSSCTAEISRMESCVEIHKNDPDPRVLARQWQGTIRQNVFQWFARQKISGRLR